MAFQTGISEEWNSVVLTTDEAWQVRAGRVFLTADAAPAVNGGLEASLGDVVTFTSGATVSFRYGDKGSTIWREAR